MGNVNNSWRTLQSNENHGKLTGNETRKFPEKEEINMKCKHCGAELVEGKPFCPSCGQNQTDTPEIPEQPKTAPGKIALAVAAVVVVLALLAAAVIGGMNSDLLNPEPTIAPTAGVVETEPVETVPPTIPADGNPDDVTCKGSYSVTDDEARTSAADVVATMGGHELTNGLLQVFYWEEVYAFLQEYGSYAAYFGLDYSQPLDVQLCEVSDGATMTWQQFFLESALNTWRSYLGMALEGSENGYELDAETREYLDGLLAQMEEQAKKDGYENLAAMVTGMVGAGPTPADYLRYIELYHEGYSYFTYVYDTTLPTPEEVEAYFAENEASYAEQGVTKDGGVYVDVRHILIQPEGGETGEDGYPVYTDEAWAAAEIEAQKVYDLYLAGDMSEDSFAQLARDHSVDGSASNGGLYTDVYEGQMVENFNNWCFDSARQVGDHALIKTQFGYHIMFFSGSRDIWYANAEYDLASQIVSSVVPAAMEKFPAQIDYSAIKLAGLSLQ